MNWVVEKACTDVAEYELVVEKQKSQWQCDQSRESWSWRINRHGMIVAQGVMSSREAAQEAAQANLPQNA